MAYTTIKKPSDYFNTKLYSGTGSNQSITGVGFQPDLIWGKGRTLAGYDHRLTDIVRGNTKLLKSNSTDVEETQTTEIQSFDSDGFTVGTGSRFNNASQTYVAWNWLANGAGSANTDGTISSTVSANTTSGFSIVSYTGNSTTGATVGHGLGATPKMIIIKSLGVENWEVYHESLGNTQGIYLNTTDAAFATSARWNNTSPTSSVWTMGNTTAVNGNGINYIAYCFADVQGYSKVSGSYVGNGSTDGTFCFTGMKPSFVMIKRTDSTASWLMFDNKRANPFNEITADLRADSSQAEDASTSYNTLDFLSNGFKIRKSNADINASGASYIYMAFAEQPLVGDNPATAR